MNVRDHDIKSRILPKKGFAMKISEWEDGSNPYTLVVDNGFWVDENDKKHINKQKFEVAGNISSWRGTSIGATHWYGKLDCFEIKLKRPDYINDTYLSIEVTKISERNMFHDSIFDDKRILVCKKGCPTDCFDSVEEAIEYIEKSFNRIFGDGWTLKGRSATDDTWEREKEYWRKDKSFAW
jgi:hypothetical protein